MSALIHPQQVTIMTTNTCTAKCGHCSVYSSPDRRGSLTESQIISAIDKLHAKYGIGLVIFAGGEPTLLGEKLLNSIAYADSLGLNTRLVTNCHWAITSAAAKIKLRQLREAGLRELNISWDDYHEPYIPVERVINAWRGSKDMQFDAVVIASASGPESKWTPAKICEALGEDVAQIYDEEGYRTDFSNGQKGRTVYLLSNSKISLIGRAEQEVAGNVLQQPEDQDTLDIACPWITGSPALSPNNRLLSCCGMEANYRPHLDFGEVKNENYSELIDAASDDVLVNAVATLGPYRMMRYLQSVEPNIAFREKYSTMCEICAHLFSRDEVIRVMESRVGEFAAMVAIRRAANGKAAEAEISQSSTSSAGSSGEVKITEEV